VAALEAVEDVDDEVGHGWGFEAHSQASVHATSCRDSRCDPAEHLFVPGSYILDSLDGGVFAGAGASPALAAACDALIGPQRWTAPIRPGAAVVVRLPSQERANAGYHIEGS